MEKEKKIFLEKCSAEDREKLLGKQKMTYEDFMRFTYLVSQLGFNEYELELYKTFAKNFYQKEENLIRLWKEEGWKPAEPAEIEEELVKRRRWMKDFLKEKE